MGQGDGRAASDAVGAVLIPLQTTSFALLLSAVMTAGVSLSSITPWFQGLSEDVLFAARYRLGLEPAVEASPSVIVAIDEETYRRPPFVGTPRVTWTPLLGEVIEGALDAGAAVIGQDLILPTSLEALAPGIDRPYLRALSKGDADGRIVLGAVRHQGEEVAPHPSHTYIAGGRRNVRLLNLITDPDGVIRKVPQTFANMEGGRVTAFAQELASRSGVDMPPRSDQHTMPINFRGDPAAIPVYSLADILACTREGRIEFLRNAFGSKVVLIGAVLDLEDRKTTSARYLGRVDGEMFAPRCVHAVMTSVYGDGVARGTIPGVTIHAQAVNDLLAGPRLSRMPDAANQFITFGFILLSALSVLLLPTGMARMVLCMIVGASVVAGLGLFLVGFVLPFLQALAGSVLAGGASYAFRFAVTDRDRRRLSQSFSKYLSPAVVAELAASGEAPKLGGEAREVTIWFSDLAGFTEMSEGMTPEELVTALNAYLTIVTGVIIAHRGMIDKYIGDAVVGVFGAPLDEPEHASNALRAVQDCNARLAEFAATRGGDWPATRVGIHTGTALVGNIGSEMRLDYTVMGDAVNLAARLESLNKRYGSHVLISEATIGAAAVSGFRQIDRVQVVGRSVPTSVYSSSDGLSESHLAIFEQARKALESGSFLEAAEHFQMLAEVDPVAVRLHEYSKELATRAPTGWAGYTVLDSK